MSAHQKLTDDQVKFIRDIVSKRREAKRVLCTFPTNAQLAEQLGCTERWVEKISAGDVRRGTSVRPNIDEIVREAKELVEAQVGS